MYRNVRAMLAKYDITVVELGNELNISSTAISQKLTGKRPFLLEEADAIRNLFNSKGENLTIDNLFFENVFPIVNN